MKIRELMPQGLFSSKLKRHICTTISSGQFDTYPQEDEYLKMNKITTKRQFLGWIAALGGAYGLGLATPRLITYIEGAPLREAVNSVLSANAVPTGLDIGKPVAKLIEAGAIDPVKVMEVYKSRGPVPEWVANVLDGKPQELILSLENAAFNLNFLWPLGLATRASFNDKSPLRGKDLPNFASTGGWTLGVKNNGAAYFNQVDTLALSPEQAVLVYRLAANIFRPCCGNSAFFQDCNHGSAMLGLLELAASNGYTSEDILNLAKVANGLWYPEKYIETALFFDSLKGISWENIPADLLLSAEYSSIGGWNKNVRAVLADQKTFLRRQQAVSGGRGCGI